MKRVMKLRVRTLHIKTWGKTLTRYLSHFPKRSLYAFLTVLLLPGLYFSLTAMVANVEARRMLSDISSPLFNLMATAALVHAALQTRKFSMRFAWGWGILAIAQLSFVIGDIVWAFLELGFGIAPFPSLADGFYLMFYPLFFMGVSLFSANRFHFVEWIKRTLDVSIIMIAATIGYSLFLIGPSYLQVIETPILERILTIAYPTGDLVLLFGLLLVVYYRKESALARPIWIMVASTVVMIVSDSIFCYQTLIGTYASGGILDYGWTLSYMLTALAGIDQAVHIQTMHAENKQLDRKLSEAGKTDTGFLSYLPYVGIAVCYSLLFRNFRNPGIIENFEILMVGVGCIMVLIIVRQIITLSENNYLLSSLRKTLYKMEIQAEELEWTNKDLRKEIAERNRVEAQLAHDALHDGLTGLANRVLFMDRLGHAFEINRREHDFNYAILFLDLDTFKAINDGLGHSAGDKALIEVGMRLRNCIRSIDTVARFGGDEFVILLENTAEKNAALSVAKRILIELDRPFALKGSEVQINCSIGIVQGFAEYTNPEDVLRDVDIAMYRAKEKGKARYELFNLDMRTSALSLIAIETDLRRAIANCEFVLAYQPIYALDDNAIVGLEALVRWDHPVRGVLMPSEFIHVAEKTGLIVPLGDWVLREACAQLQNWCLRFPGLDDLTMSVNISGKQIVQYDFVDKVKNTLRLTGLDPKKLKLEITENAFIENLSILNDLFTELRKIGVAFIIDDFGTGYSSLGYLKNIPVNTIKIDKSFIDDILVGEKDFEIINTIIRMAQGLGMTTVAEGIEGKDQLIKLKSMNCMFGQGYYLSKPLNVRSTENILSTR